LAVEILEFLAVATRELDESIRVMAIPTAQRWRRGDGFAPFVDVGSRLAEPARPQAIDEHAKVVTRSARVVDPSDPYVRASRQPISVTRPA
jgi:hypothetical protein